jgi:hypothetical protein
MTGVLDAPVDLAEIRTCAKPGCENTFVVGTRGFAARRKFCDEHKENKKAKGTDRRPRSAARINVDLRPPKPKADPLADQLAAVEQRVDQLLGMVAGWLTITGATQDASDIAAGKEAIAAATAELARYEAWLRKLAGGGEQVGRAMAWIGFIMAIMAVAVPILNRHGIIPDDLAQMLNVTETMVVVGDTIPTTQVGDPIQVEWTNGDHAGEPTGAFVG